MKIIEPFRNEKFGCRLISFLIVLLLLRLWEFVYGGLNITIMFFQGTLLSGSDLMYLVLLLLFLSFNLIAAMGLYRLKKWGFMFAYIAIPFSTVALGASYIPYLNRLFPIGFGVIVINMLVGSYAVYLNLKLARKGWYTDEV